MQVHCVALLQNCNVRAVGILSSAGRLGGTK